MPSFEDTTVRYCPVCKIDTEHDVCDDLLPATHAEGYHCCNNWGACADCKRDLHGTKDEDQAHVTDTDSWVCIGCLKKNYDEYGVRLEVQP